MTTFESFIPARSKKVLELTGVAPEGFRPTRDAFLAIQPDCDYALAQDLADISGGFNAILAHSPLIGRLEHEPLVQLLAALGGLLDPGGLLLLALDHIGYAENLAAILSGKPPLFKTTLTRGELEEAIKAAGLRPLRATPLLSRTPIAPKLAEISKTDARAFAHVLTAMRDEPPPATLIHTTMGEPKVCAPVRVHMPNAFLSAEANIVPEVRTSDQPYRLYGEERFKHRIFSFKHRIFINQRVIAPSFAEGAQFFDTLGQHGYLFIHEMDDFPFFRWKRYEGNGWINFISAHGIQTSTPFLADFFRQLNPNVAVFANQLRSLPPPRDFAEEARDSGRPVTIFFGALNREEDFMEILPALNHAAEQYGDRLAFNIIARPALFDAIRSERKTYIGDAAVFEGQLAPYAAYHAAMRASDIALLPLRDTLLNRAKSDLKFIECAANGAVALASPLIYSEAINDGETGFLYRSEREFADKLRILIENGERRRDIATAAYQYVRHNRLMSQHYEERLAWYRDCLARLPELQAAARARIDAAAAEPIKIAPPPPYEHEI